MDKSFNKIKSFNEFLNESKKHKKNSSDETTAVAAGGTAAVGASGKGLYKGTKKYKRMKQALDIERERMGYGVKNFKAGRDLSKEGNKVGDLIKVANGEIKRIHAKEFFKDAKKKSEAIKKGMKATKKIMAKNVGKRALEIGVPVAAATYLYNKHKKKNEEIKNNFKKFLLEKDKF